MYWFLKKLIHFSWRIITLQYCGGFCCEACGFSALWLGIEPTSPVLESKVLTNVLPGRSQGCCLLECYTEWENKESWIQTHSTALSTECVVGFSWNKQKNEDKPRFPARFQHKINSIFYFFKFNSVQFSRLVVSNSLRPHGLQHPRLPCPSPIPGACSNSCW